MGSGCRNGISEFRSGLLEAGLQDRDLRTCICNLRIRIQNLDCRNWTWTSGFGFHDLGDGALIRISDFRFEDLDLAIGISQVKFGFLDLDFDSNRDSISHPDSNRDAKAKGRLLNVRRGAVVCFRATLHGPWLTSFIDPEWTNLEIKNQCSVPLQTVFSKHHIFL